MKRRTIQTKQATVLGPVPREAGALWCFRLKVPRLPFYLDSAMSYRTLEEAKAAADKWRDRTITVTW